MSITCLACFVILICMALTNISDADVVNGLVYTDINFRALLLCQSFMSLFVRVSKHRILVFVTEPNVLRVHFITSDYNPQRSTTFLPAEYNSLTAIFWHEIEINLCDRGGSNLILHQLDILPNLPP